MFKKTRFTLIKLLKIILLILFSIFLITYLIIKIYRPVLLVKYKGEFIGYATDLLGIEKKINIELTTEDDKANFYDLEEPIIYEFKFLKKRFSGEDDKIVKEIKSKAIPKYKYFVLDLNDGINKYYFSKISDAVNVKDELKSKNSKNAEQINIKVEYTQSKQHEEASETVVNRLYKKKYVTTYDYLASRGMLTEKIDIPIELSRPISGIVTSGFSLRRYLFGTTAPHTGTDIARESGAAIKAAADGIVIYAGYSQTGYGNLVVIDHGEGQHTRYAHCSAIYVRAGQEVKEGQKIAAVGSTGQSTGPHLHFEVRYEAIALNPEYYVDFD